MSKLLLLTLILILAMLLGPRALRSFSLLLVIGRLLRLLATGAPRRMPPSARPKRLK